MFWHWSRTPWKFKKIVRPALKSKMSNSRITRLHKWYISLVHTLIIISALMTWTVMSHITKEVFNTIDIHMYGLPLNPITLKPNKTNMYMETNHYKNHKWLALFPLPWNVHPDGTLAFKGNHGWLASKLIEKSSTEEVGCIYI